MFLRPWQRYLLLLVASAAAVVGNTSDVIRFEDVASSSGIDFVLNNCPTPEKQMIETMAGGLAVFDFDGDGKPDIFLTNGASLPSLEKNDVKFNNRLYKNEGNLHFRDVTS